MQIFQVKIATGSHYETFSHFNQELMSHESITKDNKQRNLITVTYWSNCVGSFAREIVFWNTNDELIQHLCNKQQWWNNSLSWPHFWINVIKLMSTHKPYMLNEVKVCLLSPKYWALTHSKKKKKVQIFQVRTATGSHFQNVLPWSFKN